MSLNQRQSTIHRVTLADTEYPAVLRMLDDPPAVLYGHGQWTTLHKPAIAIVGARRCSQRASALAFELGKQVALRGWCVVSGLARGIDAAAHRGALAAGVSASTVAVFGCGINVIYPPEHDRLAMEICQAEGLLMSEFAFDAPPRPSHFPQRNRLVASLSRATVVVQAQRRSGSMITARLAAQMGREVFAVPGLPGDPLAAGSHELLRQGAALLEDARDIWREFGIAELI